MTNQSQTDGVVDPQTEEVLSDVVPPEEVNTDEVKKTRNQKTAEKLGISVEALKETKQNKAVSERLTQLEETLQPVIEQAKTVALKNFFDSNADSGDFEVFQKEYETFVSLGADPVKAKEEALNRAKDSKEETENQNRVDVRGKLSLPPTSDSDGKPHQFKLLKKEEFQTLLKNKGVGVYNKYCKYWADQGNNSPWIE